MPPPAPCEKPADRPKIPLEYHHSYRHTLEAQQLCAADLDASTLEQLQHTLELELRGRVFDHEALKVQIHEVQLERDLFRMKLQQLEVR